MKIEDIKFLDYSKIVGLLDERNRPSGGIRTVQEVCVNAFINKDSKVLEIGSNTGFTSVNISLLTGASVTGIEINQPSIDKANSYKNKLGANNVNFVQASATDLPFAQNTFDLVWASNVTSFIHDKDKAINEYFRVLNYRGYLALIPIYYIKTPPDSLVQEVSTAINSKINVWDKAYWINKVDELCKLDDTTKLELVYSADFSYDDKSDSVEKYVDLILQEANLNVSEEIHKELKKRYLYFMELFNRNLQYCGYSILLFQKRTQKDQIELFTNKRYENHKAL